MLKLLLIKGTLWGVKTSTEVADHSAAAVVKGYCTSAEALPGLSINL